MNGDSKDCVDLAAACRVLATSPELRRLLKAAVGASGYPAALRRLKAGKLDGERGVALHALLVHSIANGSQAVWSGWFVSDDEYPVHVNAFHGVYWVWALECEPVGYFLDRDAAIAFVRANWDEVREHEAGDDDEEGEVRCPFCDAPDDACEHLLLMVDTTFRESLAGALFDAFGARWSAITGQADDADFDEREAFGSLLDEVESLSDYAASTTGGGAPGISARYGY